MMETWQQALPHGITLSCRATGQRGRPVLVFLHGFPEGAFVWDALLTHFSRPENGGYRCVAPNLRGFEQSTAPAEVSAYRPKHLVQDIAALIDIEAGGDNAIAALIAHDWGGAVAWNLANQMPQRMEKLVIFNSPHPGTFLRELKNSPSQQEASAYMNFLVQPGAEQHLAANDFARMWAFFTDMGNQRKADNWLTEDVKQQYRNVWSHGLQGGCNYYRASPLRPATAADPAASVVEIPASMLTIVVPTLVVWGMDDTALPPALIEGLDAYVQYLTVHKVEDATHWIIHEQPELAIQLVQDYLSQRKG